MIGGVYYYYVYNGHGDVVALIDECGAMQNSYSYDEWGNVTPSGTVSNSIMYAGEYFDQENGSYYLRVRYYDPGIGRFINEDPARDGLNWYVYCSNNPVNRIDPSGLFDYNTVLSYSQTYNEDVEVLQNELVWLGYMEAPPEGQWGYFGPKTQAAVQKLCGKNYVDVDTWASLGLIYRSQADIDAGVQIVTIDRDQYFDVTVPINNLFYNAGVEASKHYLDFNWFRSMVDKGKPWDIKREEPWDDALGITYPGSTSPVILFGSITTPEELGNIMYGYTGTAAGFPEDVLILGSIYASGIGKGNASDEEIMN